MDQTLNTKYCNLNKVDSIGSTTQTNQFTISDSKNIDQETKDITLESFSFIEFIENVIPNVGTELIYVLIQMIETHFIGQKGDNDILDAIGIAQSYNTIITLFIGFGIIDVMDTICSRSFGKNDFHKLGNQTNQIRFIIAVFVSIFSIINIFFADNILSYMISDKNYLSDAHLYIKIVTPSILVSLNYEIYCRYFQVQLVYKPVMVSLIIALIVHPVICWLFISYLDMGIVGAGLCSNITELLRFLCVFIFSGCCNPYPKSNICPSKEIFNSKFCSILKLSAISAGLFLGESGGYSIVEFITARMGDTILAQHITLVNITLITFAFSTGFLNTNAILVGNYAGRNSPINVKRIIKISTITSLLVFIPILITIAIFPTQLLKFFAESDDVWGSNGMTQLIYISCINNFFDFQQSNIQGFLRGLGIINMMFLLTFVSYCLLLPGLCYLFAFYLNWKLKGIWLSMLFINFIVFLFNLIILCRSNIEKLCEDYEEEDEFDESIDEKENLPNNIKKE